MFRTSCLLEVHHADDRDTRPSGSGIVLDSESGLIISHASLLWPCLSTQDKEKVKDTTYLQSADLLGYKVRVIFENSNSNTHSTKAEFNPKVAEYDFRGTHRSVHLEAQGRVCSDRTKGEISELQGKVVHLWKSVTFGDTLARMMPPQEGWKFTDDGHLASTQSQVDTKENRANNKSMNNPTKSDTTKTKTDSSVDSNQIFQMLPFFVLIQARELSQFLTCHSSIVQPSKTYTGQPVWLSGTPFGSLSPSIFLNSVSRGVLSNVIGAHQELLLTDARAIPGSEGGGIYTDQGEVIGMIVAALCWKSSEWIGLSIGCSLHQALASLRDYELPLPSDVKRVISSAVGQKFVSRSLGVPIESVSHHNHQVVLVRCGGSWGTGVVVDPRQEVLVTCSHVVRASHHSAVLIKKTNPFKTVRRARVVYASPVGEPFDIAVLKLSLPGGFTTETGSSSARGSGEGTEEEQQRSALRVDENRSQVLDRTGPKCGKYYRRPREGENVIAVGHACFDENLGCQPSVTKGIVSKVIQHRGIPIIIQSTCAVHAGASGGPLLAEDGTVLGILACNARDTVSGSSYPHVNMSVPMATIWPMISAYLETGSIDPLNDIHLRNSEVKALWKLEDDRPTIHSNL